MLNLSNSILQFAEYFLSHPYIWFNPKCSYDEVIKEKFGEIYDDDKNIDKLKKLKNISKKINIALVLVFDQLPYYIYRNDTNKIRELQSLNFEFAYELFKNHINYYSPRKQCFIMLALRHSQNTTLINKVIKKTVELRKQTDDKENIYKRFYKASLQQLSELNNKILFNNLKISDDKYKSKNICKDILDINSNFIDLDSMVFDTSDKLLNNTYNHLKKFYQKNYITHVCVSFSGGVDSTLLLYLLSYVPNLKVTAFHINYGNRDTVDKEIEMCYNFCKSLDIDLYIRNITEIKRQRDYDRDIYEDITHKIRFDCYKKIATDFGYTIALGHNKDDCLENIISNICKQNKYDNLMGMTQMMEEKDLIITRPFLELSKKDIYHIAKVCKIPYLYDSTPKWSERGKKRDILFPQLDEFDPRILSGLYELSKICTDMSEMNNNAISSNWELIKEEDDKYLIKLYDYYNNNITSLYHLKSLLGNICKKIEIPYFSNKSIKHLWEHPDFCNQNSVNVKISLNKTWYYFNYFDNETQFNVPFITNFEKPFNSPLNI